MPLSRTARSKRRTRFARLAGGAFVATAFAANVAWADKVAVLPFHSGGGATSGELDQMRAAAEASLGSLGHVPATQSELLTATMSAKDGVPDSSGEYRAAGRASGSQWTVLGRLGHRGPAAWLELEVGQVESGRVESLAREIDVSSASRQIGEMLALLLRPEGIANAEIPWSRHVSEVAKPTPEAAPVASKTPDKQAPPARPYADGKPLALGVGAGFAGALSRPGNARGSSTSLHLFATLAYALSSMPGLELKANVAGGVAGPGSVRADAGGRYAFGVVPSARVFLGPEIGLGVFVPTGGDQTARFFARGSVFLAWAASDVVQVELAGDLGAAPGGSGAIVLGGGSIAGLVRF